MPALDSFGPQLVRVRSRCEPYLARCNGKTASSTNAPEFAAASAAAKYFGVRPDVIRLHSNDDCSFLAAPASSAPEDWQSASAIVQAWIARMYPVLISNENP